MRKQMAAWMVGLMLGIPTVAVAEKAPPPNPVSVFVWTQTDPSGLIDNAARLRKEQVQCIEARLAKVRKPIVLVTDASRANVSFEVKDVTEPDVKWLATTWHQHFILRVGTYETELVGPWYLKRPGNFTGYQVESCGEAAIRMLKEWVKLNQAVLAGRQTSGLLAPGGADSPK